jgi:hypothetical protein
MFQAVPPLHHQEHKNVHTASGIDKLILLPAAIVDEMELEFHLIHEIAVHVSCSSSAHRQEHKTVHTASGIAKQYCCLLLSWMR